MANVDEISVFLSVYLFNGKENFITIFFFVKVAITLDKIQKCVFGYSLKQKNLSMEDENLTLSVTERMILSNQFRIRALLSKDASEKKAFDHWAELLEWGYESQYYLFEQNYFKTVPSSVTNEVFTIVSMYQDIEQSLKKLSSEALSQLNINELTFQGFNDNTEHFAFLSFHLKHNPGYGSIKNLKQKGYKPTSEYLQKLAIFKSFGSMSFGTLNFEQLKNLQEK